MVLSLSARGLTNRAILDQQIILLASWEVCSWQFSASISKARETKGNQFLKKSSICYFLKKKNLCSHLKTQNVVGIPYSFIIWNGSYLELHMR